MTIDWSAFTPFSSLAGGVLIGCAAAVLVLFNGRIAGISGIVGALVKPRPGEVTWRVAFLVGLMGAPAVYQRLFALPQPRIEAGWPTLLLAGLLVGFGTRLGSGCTSGHGVCGLSRRSPRSLTATLTFMATGALTVYLTRHLL